LKNGSIIRGIIIEQVPNKSIKIETADKSVFVYQMDEITKITKEAYPMKSNRGQEGTGLKTGYLGLVELGGDFGIGTFQINRARLNIINGYQINPYFSAGMG